MSAISIKIFGYKDIFSQRGGGGGMLSHDLSSTRTYLVLATYRLPSSSPGRLGSLGNQLGSHVTHYFFSCILHALLTKLTKRAAIHQVKTAASYKTDAIWRVQQSPYSAVGRSENFVKWTSSKNLKLKLKQNWNSTKTIELEIKTLLNTCQMAFVL